MDNCRDKRCATSCSSSTTTIWGCSISALSKSTDPPQICLGSARQFVQDMFYICTGHNSNASITYPTFRINKVAGWDRKYAKSILGFLVGIKQDWVRNGIALHETADFVQVTILIG